MHKDMRYLAIPKVDCKYGAPMGRPESKVQPEFKGKLHLIKVPFVDQCYDAGGAYWGLPSNLYWFGDATGTIYHFVRADDRLQAKAKAQFMYPHARFYR